MQRNAVKSSAAAAAALLPAGSTFLRLLRKQKILLYVYVYNSYAEKHVYS